MTMSHVVVLVDTEDGRPKHVVVTVLGPMTEADATETAERINSADVSDMFYADIVALAEFSAADIGSLISELRGDNE